MHYYSL